MTKDIINKLEEPLREHIVTLKKASKDSEHGIYMSDSDLKVI